ncbi:class I adenylate-forming enzyme family protein [Rhodococcus sp. NPDC058514]|uniref:class I adenylate-forming enzyme family protein n=1 Tax=Rhodococcus sp. NPDC058514 TaxID=3346532 RepID=UPI0036675D99
MERTLGQLLSRRAYLTPDKEAWIGRDYRYTFAQVDRRVDLLAAYLRAAGVGAGDRIALLAKNGEFHATTVFAAARLGAIAVVLNWRLPAPELQYVLEDATPAAFVYDHEFASVVAALEGVPAVRVCSAPDAADDSTVDYREVTARPWQPLEPVPAPAPNDPVVIMYTSGTTGKPTGAMISHENLLWSAQGCAATLEWHGGHRFLLVAPMFHIGGFNPVVTNTVQGTPCVYLPDFDPVVVWDTIARERITTMMAVPVMLQALLAVAAATEVDASSLVNVTCGGSPVSVDLIEAAGRAGITVQAVYGITEFSGALTYWTREMGIDAAATQGRAMMFGEIKIVDADTGRDVPAGTAGEVWCRGPMVFTGYWNNPDATASALIDGWYRSGDIGLVDERNFLHLKDRLKDMIISGGENIYPVELERVLARHPAVREVAVVARADARWGEVPVAHVVVEPGSTLAAEDLIAYGREHLASYKSTKDVVFADALPKNSVGKILKRQLRAA